MARTPAGWVVGLLAFLPAVLAGESQRKPRLAVMDFEYAAVMEQAQAVFGTHVNIGRGISALLASRVVGGHLYHVVERGRIDSLLREQDLGGDGRVKPGSGARSGRIHGADAILMGDIVVFGRDDKRRTIKFGALVSRFCRIPGIGAMEWGHKEEKAVVVIQYRLVDAETSEVLHSAEARGESVRKSRNWRGLLGIGSSGGADAVDMTASNFAQTIIGEATIQAVSRLAEALNAQVGRLPVKRTEIQARVADVSGSSVILNAGRKDGVVVNDRFEIARIRKEIRHPITQEILNTVTDRLGYLLITEVRENVASGAYSGAVPPQVGDMAVKN